MEKETPQIEDVVSPNLERLQQMMQPARDRIERDAMSQLAAIDEKVQAVSDILHRYNITEPVDEAFFDDLLFNLNIAPHLQNGHGYDFEVERNIVEACLQGMERRRPRR